MVLPEHVMDFIAGILVCEMLPSQDRVPKFLRKEWAMKQRIYETLPVNIFIKRGLKTCIYRYTN
jgi:hypothetical protein